MQEELGIGIIAFAFGTPATIMANCRIAAIAAGYSKQYSAAIYTQLDVNVESEAGVERTEEVPGSPPPTLRIARGAVAWALRNNIKELVVVAAMPHHARAVRDTLRAVEEAGASIGVYEVKEAINAYFRISWFCTDSTQPRTTSRRAWWPREIFLRLLPFGLYKRIAG